MKVRVERVHKNEINIVTEFIKLEAFLKLANAVGSGGMAKNVIQDGLVTVNGQTCTMRGKKLYDGDKVGFDGVSYFVRHAD